MPRRSERTEALTLPEARLNFTYDEVTGKLHRAATKGKYKAGQEVGFMSSSGYLRTRLNGIDYYVHRIVWLLTRGEWPVNEIDHIDHDKTNNRSSNLRDVTHAANMLNFPKNSNTGVKGVTRVGSKFQVTLWLFDRAVTIGRFDNLDEAVSVSRDAFALRAMAFDEAHTQH